MLKTSLSTDFIKYQEIIHTEILYASSYVVISLRYSWDLMLLFVYVCVFVVMLVLNRSGHETWCFR